MKWKNGWLTLGVMFIILFLASCTCPTKVKYLYDEEGRIKIYHGINVANSSKTSVDNLPWTKKEDLMKLSVWGFNLVRYLVFWSAIEPKKDSINVDYINKVIARLTYFKTINIDVVVDIHQDVYGAYFKGVGCGFPDWTVDDDSIPFTLQQPWNANYLEPAVVAAYRNFWNNAEMQKQYVEMTSLVFSFVDTLSNVIGVNVMNEPFPTMTDNFVKALKEKKIQNMKLEDLAELATFERDHLSKLYADILTEIKVKNYKKQLWFEPVIYTSAGIPTFLKFETENSVYYPHYYDPLCHEGKPYQYANSELMKESMKIKVLEANKFKSPILFGEWGIGQNVEYFQKYLVDFLDFADEYTYGWTYYCYDPGHPFSIIDTAKVETAQLGLLCRPYPQRIAGINPRYRINGDAFELTYINNARSKAQTIIYVPYNKVKVETGGSYTKQGNLIYYTNSKERKQHIYITPE
jgi:endoglycosylceramidase